MLILVTVGVIVKTGKLCTNEISLECYMYCVARKTHQVWETNYII